MMRIQPSLQISRYIEAGAEGKHGESVKFRIDDHRRGSAEFRIEKNF